MPTPLRMSDGRTDVRPTIIFLHGFLDEASLWEPVIARIDADRYRCLAIDLPGVGARSDANGPFDLLNLTATVLDVVDAATTPVTIVGHSMGTQLAELTAVARPTAVTAIALVTPVPLGGIALPLDVAETMRGLGGDREGQIALRTQFAGPLSDATLARLIDVGMKVRPAVAAALFDTWSTGDASGARPTAFRGPVLIVSGDADGFVTPELLDTVIAPRFPQATVRVVAGPGHWPHVEQPAETAAILTEFLAAIPARRDG